jgi:hypothetical protein
MTFLSSVGSVYFAYHISVVLTSTSKRYDWYRTIQYRFLSIRRLVQYMKISSSIGSRRPLEVCFFARHTSVGWPFRSWLVRKESMALTGAHNNS